MLQSLISYLKQWSKTTEPRVQLQHTYIALTVAIVLVAGMVSLLNFEAGRLIAGFATMAIAVFIANAIIWALVQSFTLSYLTDRRSTKK